MPTVIDTSTARRYHDEGAQFLEVLPADAYRNEHIPGAFNVPMPELTDQRAAAVLDRDRPVVVYCYDTECDLSSRGAARLEAFGFRQVFDYTGSKTAWLGMHLPFEGTASVNERAGGLARPAATCTPETELADLPAAGPGGVVLVVDGTGRVLGSVRPEASGGAGTALDVAHPSPSSVRPSITADELAASMDRSGEAYVVVSKLDGVLIGVVERGDLHVDR